MTARSASNRDAGGIQVKDFVVRALVAAAIALAASSCGNGGGAQAASGERPLPPKLTGEGLPNPGFSYGEADGYSWRERDIAFPSRPGPLDARLACSTLWLTSKGQALSPMIAFFGENVFMYGSYQTGVEFRGNYDILEDGSMRLSGYPLRPEGPFSSPELVLAFRPISDFWFAYELSSADGALALYPLGGETPNGQLRDLPGAKVEVARGSVVVAERDVFRASASEEGAPVEHFAYGFSLMNPTSALYRGTVAFRLARSVDPAGWSFIGLQVSESMQLGWVRSASLAEYDELLAEAYQAQLAEELSSLQ
jgi:hypothetical protein